MTDDAVRREPAYGLPAWTYENEELLTLEYERLILGTWQIVCHQNDLPEPGDYFTFDLMRDSLIFIRDRDGSIRGFQNVCRHRGARLLDGKGSLKTRLMCPYHGWAYHLDGRLAAVPAEGTFPGLDKSCFGLKEVETEIFLGFVFVRVAGEGPSVAERWGDLAARIAPYKPEEMVADGEIHIEEWACDWKTAVDNNQENYHIPVGHPGYFRLLERGIEDFGNEHGVSGSTTRHAAKPSDNWVERMYQELAPKALTHLPEAERVTWRFFSMLPTHGIDVYPDSMDFFQILPLGPGRCQIRLGVYGLPNPSREVGVLRYLNERINRQVLHEDRWLSERVQAGLRSHGYNPGPLSTKEDGVKELHDIIRAACPVAHLTQAPAPGTVRAVDAEMASARQAAE